jgi:hypothetical protein
MILPSEITIPGELTKVLTQTGQKPKAAIGSIWDRLRTQAATDARPGVSRRMGPGSYYGDRLATGENLAGGGLQTALEGVGGNTTYGDWKSERANQQAMALAKLSGGMMQPNSLEEALTALGGAARLGGQLYALKGMYPTGSSSYIPRDYYTSNYGSEGVL